MASPLKFSRVRVYDREGKLIWPAESDRAPVTARESHFINHAMRRFIDNPSLTSRAIVDADEGQDVVRGVAPILSPEGQQLLGVVALEERFETQILQSVELIIHEFASLKPSAELNRLSYVMLLTSTTVSGSIHQGKFGS